MDKAHEVQVLGFEGPIMHLNIDGKEYRIDLGKESKRLAAATQAQRERLEISASGYGIHWPEVDEDLSVDGLIGIRHEGAVARFKG